MNAISHDDMKKIKEFALKYNMNVADFGRTIVRQAEGNQYRQIRLSDDEYKTILERAKKNGVTITRWCSIACHAFLTGEIKEELFLDTTSEDGGNRIHRIAVAINNKKEDTELLKVASEKGIKISALIRYCALHFDGKDMQE